MRSMGRLTTGLALLSLLPAVAAAQEARPFTDSWFWGIKGGAMTVETPFESSVAPTVGVDWLITRTRAGLYMSVEQGFFEDQFGTVFDGSSASGMRDVSLKNFRRASFALMAFPKPWGSVRPYAGLGLALNLVQKARPIGSFDDLDSMAEVAERVEDRRSRTSVLFTGGVQGMAGPVNLFAQATAMPTGSGFLLNGADSMYLLEAGVRFNVGSAIERIDR
jgi:hypothetical protein